MCGINTPAELRAASSEIVPGSDFDACPFHPGIACPLSWILQFESWGLVAPTPVAILDRRTIDYFSSFFPSNWIGRFLKGEDPRV